MGLSKPPEDPKQAPNFFSSSWYGKVIWFLEVLCCLYGQCIPYKSPRVSVTLSIINFFEEWNC